MLDKIASRNKEFSSVVIFAKKVFVMVDQWIKKGVEHCQKGDFKEGVTWFDKVLVSTPNNAEALSHRARALSRVGRLADSLADFKLLADLLPTNAQIIGDLAVALHLNDRNEEAATMFDKALRLDPSNPYRYSSRAFFKDRIGDAEGAIADYNKCIELDPEDAIALNNKGLVEEKLGWQQQAEKSFDKSNELVGYKPREVNPKTQALPEGRQAPKSKELKDDPASLQTRWDVVKSVFTKEGFRDFLQFSVGLVKKKV